MARRSWAWAAALGLLTPPPIALASEPASPEALLRVAGSLRPVEPTGGDASVPAPQLTDGPERPAPSGPVDAVDLPPVTVPLPDAEDAPPPPSSPARRDPTGVVYVVHVDQRTAAVTETSSLLARAPAVLVQDFGPGQTKTLSLRGASANGVLVLLDGLPLNGAGGAVDLSLLSPAVLERIEVLGGAAGARYGSGGLGGAVNLVTPVPDRALRLRAKGAYGSFGTGRGELAASFPVGNGAGLVLLHGGRSNGDFTYLWDDRPQLPGNPLLQQVRANNASQQGGALLKWRGRAGDVDLDGMADLSLVARGIPGTDINPTVDASERTGLGALSLRATRRLESGELSLRGYGKQEANLFTGGFFGAELEQTQRVAGLELDGSWLAGLHALSAQVHAAWEGMTESTGVNPAWLRSSAQVMDEWLVTERLSLAPSLRFDQVGPFLGASPKLGGALELGSDFKLKANLASAFRAPSFLELYVAQASLFPNAHLRPERVLAADLSVERAFSHGELRATAFASRYLELISYEYQPPNLARPENLGGALASGAELHAQLEPVRWLRASAAYTLMFTSLLGVDARLEGREMPYRPRHRLRTRVEGGAAFLRAHLEADLQSAQFTNRTNTVSLPGWALVDAGLSALVWKDPELTLSLEVKNLLDAQAHSFNGYPLPGRAAYLSLSFQLDRSPPARAGDAVSPEHPEGTPP